MRKVFLLFSPSSTGDGNIHTPADNIGWITVDSKSTPFTQELVNSVSTNVTIEPLSSAASKYSIRVVSNLGRGNKNIAVPDHTTADIVFHHA